MKTIGPLNLYNSFSPYFSNMKDMVVTSICGFKLFHNSIDYTFVDGSDIISALALDVNKEIPWDISQPKPSAEFFVIGSVHSDSLVHNAPFSISCGSLKKSLIAHALGYIEDGFFKKKISYNEVADNFPIKYPTETVINELSSGLGDLCTRLSLFSKNLDTISSIDKFDSSSYICQQPISTKLLNSTKLVPTLPDFLKSDQYPLMIDYFDNDIFYRAHSSQRIPTYWRGDESFELNGLHPVYRNFTGKLPGINFKFFYTYKKNFEIHSSVSNIDTIIFIPDSEVCLIIGRALVPNAGVEFNNVDVLMPAFEYSLSSRSDEYYHKVFRLRTGTTSSSDFVLHDAQLSPSIYALPDVNRFFSSASSEEKEEKNSDIFIENNSEIDSILMNNSYIPKFGIENHKLFNSDPLDISFSAETDTSLSDDYGGYDIASSNIEVDNSSNLLLQDSREDFLGGMQEVAIEADFFGKVKLSDIADVEKLLELHQANSSSDFNQIDSFDGFNSISSDDALKLELDLSSIQSVVISERLAFLDKYKSIPDYQVNNDFIEQINISMLNLGLSTEPIQSSDSETNDLSDSISSDGLMLIISDLRKQLLNQQAELDKINVVNLLTVDGVEPDVLIVHENEPIDSSPAHESPSQNSTDTLAEISEEMVHETVEIVNLPEYQNFLYPVFGLLDDPAQRLYVDVTFPKDYINRFDFENYTFRNCRFVGSLTHSRFNNCFFLDCEFSNTEIYFVDFLTSRFVDCNFSFSSHTNISFVSSNFKNINLNKASFCDAVITEIEFLDSLLIECSFKRTKFTQLSIFSSNLERSEISDAQFFKGLLLESNLSHAAVINSSFSDFKFTQSQFDSTSIDHCSFHSVSFIDSSLNSVSFLRVTAPELSMIDCSCCASHFEYSDFNKSTFIQCDFSSAFLKNNIFSNSSLNRSNLSASTIYKSQFVGGELRLVNLSLAIVKGCELLNVDLAGATLDSADFTDSYLPFDLGRYL